MSRPFSDSPLAFGSSELLGGHGSVGDYFALMKPRVMSLVVFTAFVGIMVAPGHLHPWLAAVSLLCIAVGAGASGALNMGYDADIDVLMARTALRPIPQRRILPREAFAFGVFLAVSSVLVLSIAVGWFAGLFLAFTIFFYVVIYTMWLKRRTVQNIVIGGAAGAFPPMLGWMCVTGAIDWPSFSLFLLIFFWTPPHFWALSLYCAHDYARAGVPMMPVKHGLARTRREILLYSYVLFFIALLPYGLGIGGVIYAVFAFGLSLLFVGLAAKIWWEGDRGGQGRRWARFLFHYSLFYLFALFFILLCERLMGIGV